MMTVKELRDRLAEYPDDYMVVMSSDGEGNSASPASDTSQERYVPESTWSGEFRDKDETDEGDLVFVLWPTN